MIKELTMEHDSITSIAGKVTYAGAGSAVFFGMTANEFAAIGGLCIATVGLIVNIIFKILGHRALLKHHKEVESKVNESHR